MTQKKWTLSSLQEYGKQYLVGGVSSNFRINRFTGIPMYVSRADGAYSYDITGKKYIDYFMGHGAVLLGHNRPEIKEAILAVLENGFFAQFDAPLVIELAKLITEIIPCAEQVRFPSSGSEATLLAMRLARGFTGREKIIRMDGHFHGIHDYVLFNNLAALVDYTNPGDRPSRINPFSAGIPRAIARETMIVIPWNNLEMLEKVIHQEAEQIAGIITNPVDFNNGCITTTREYLEKVNEIAHDHEMVVIYDEVLSGFRVGLSCAQGYYGVTPDLCTLSKALSNGVPIAAVAGKKEIMSKIIDPELPVAHGGTFSGNLMGAAAAIASLNIMRRPDFYPQLFATANLLFEKMQDLFDEEGIPARVQHLGSSFYIYFGITEPLTDYRDFKKVDQELTQRFFRGCIEKGLYFHTDFTVSAAHTQADIDETLEKMRAVIKQIK